MASREVFKKNLLDFMVRENYSRSELAKAVGVSKSTVTTWLTGRSYPRIDVIQRIADILQCTTDELVADNPEILASELAEKMLRVRNVKPLEDISREETLTITTLRNRFELQMLLEAAEKLENEDIMRLIMLANRFVELYRR